MSWQQVYNRLFSKYPKGGGGRYEINNSWSWLAYTRLLFIIINARRPAVSLTLNHISHKTKCVSLTKANYCEIMNLPGSVLNPIWLLSRVLHYFLRISVIFFRLRLRILNLYFYGDVFVSPTPQTPTRQPKFSVAHLSKFFQYEWS